MQKPFLSYYNIYITPAIKYPAASNGVFGLRFASVGAERVPLAHSTPRGIRQIAMQAWLFSSLLAGIKYPKVRSAAHIGRDRKQMERIKISIRNLVEFILRSGDIDNRKGRAMQKEAMQEGSRIHRKIQRRMGASYEPEVFLKTELARERYILVLEGRADGVITEEEKVTIDFAFATVVTIRPITAGEPFTKENIWVKRPGTGPIRAEHYEELLGRRAAQNIPNDTHVSWDMIGE